MLELGIKAPDFELPDQNGEVHKLSDYAGKKVILYFYPILSCKVSFHSTKFSTDRGYATSIDMNIYLWKEDIEDGESVMTAEYRPVEYGKDYDVVNNPDKFQLYIDGKEIK